MIQLLIVLIVVAMIASLAIWAIRRAPEPVLNAEFKAVLSWIIIVAAVIILVVKILTHFNINI